MEPSHDFLPLALNWDLLVMWPADCCVAFSFPWFGELKTRASLELFLWSGIFILASVHDGGPCSSFPRPASHFSQSNPEKRSICTVFWGHDIQVMAPLGINYHSGYSVQRRNNMAGSPTQL